MKDKKYIAGLIIFGILLITSVSLLINGINELNENKARLAELNIEINKQRNIIDSINSEFVGIHNLLDTNRRLYQHYVAHKYSHLPPTKENIKAFCLEAKVLSPEMNYGVAQKETGFVAGTAKYNNLHGFKGANRRFSWASGKKSQNNSCYEHWAFSCLDYDEYLRAGNSNWSLYEKGFK
jgi:hypothetical protein